MEPSRAAEHLQVIRTLMERSSLYRRALAPIMIYAGLVGTVAGAVALRLTLTNPAHFVAYWYLVGAIAIAGSLVLVRRQAWQQAESFWSPPTRRVALATLPSLTAGFLLGLLVFLRFQFGLHFGPEQGAEWMIMIGLPCTWVILYGCAAHAAGFYTTRGMKLLGWLLIIAGSATLLFPVGGKPLAVVANWIMAFYFGCVHLAYGVYLYFTERRGNEA